MSKLKLLSIAVIGLLVINIVIVGFLLMKKPPIPPFGPGGRPPMNQEGPKKIIIERLHFDKEQTDAYEKLIDAHQASVRILNDSIKMAKNDLYRSLQSETFTGKDSLINQLGRLQKQVELLHYEHFAEIKKLCKPDQLNSFNDLTKDLARFFAPGKKDAPPPKD